MPARSTTPDLDGYGLHDHRLARPAGYASHPVSVRQVVALLHASFRPRLATTPLRFANPSPPSGWIGDLHPQAVAHARRTPKKKPANNDGLNPYQRRHGGDSSYFSKKDDAAQHQRCAPVEMSHSRNTHSRVIDTIKFS